MSRLRSLLTILLIASALCGTQAIQASPLHDHGNHVVNCGLCHFTSDHAALPESSLNTWTPETNNYLIPEVIQAVPDTSPSPYLGRAPPR